MSVRFVWCEGITVLMCSYFVCVVFCSIGLLMFVRLFVSLSFLALRVTLLSLLWRNKLTVIIRQRKNG